MIDWDQPLTPHPAECAGPNWDPRVVHVFDDGTRVLVSERQKTSWRVDENGVACSGGPCVVNVPEFVSRWVNVEQGRYGPRLAVVRIDIHPDKSVGVNGVTAEVEEA